MTSRITNSPVSRFWGFLSGIMAVVLMVTFAACTDQPEEETDMMQEDTVEMDIAPAPLDTAGMMMDTTAMDTTGGLQ